MNDNPIKRALEEMRNTRALYEQGLQGSDFGFRIASVIIRVSASNQLIRILESALAELERDYWVTPIHKGMEDAPKNRLILVPKGSVWVTASWAGLFTGYHGYYEQGKTQAMGFTRWCELPPTALAPPDVQEKA